MPPLEEGSGNAELAAAGRELNALEGADRFSVWSLTRLRWTRPGRVIVRCRQPDLHVRKRQLAGKQGHANPFRLEMEYASWADLGEQVSAASNALARARAACQNLLEMSPFLTR